MLVRGTVIGSWQNLAIQNRRRPGRRNAIPAGRFNVPAIAVDPRQRHGQQAKGILVRAVCLGRRGGLCSGVGQGCESTRIAGIGKPDHLASVPRDPVSLCAARDDRFARIGAVPITCRTWRGGALGPL